MIGKSPVASARGVEQVAPCDQRMPFGPRRARAVVVGGHGATGRSTAGEEIRSLRRPSRTSHPAWWISRWQARTDHDAVGQRRLAAQFPGHDVVDLAPGRGAVAAGTAAVAGGDGPRAGHRGRCGCSARRRGVVPSAEHDRDDRGVAAQHPQRLRAHRAAELEHAVRARFSRSSSRTTTLQLRAPSAALGHTWPPRGRARKPQLGQRPRPGVGRGCGGRRRRPGVPGRRAPRRSRRTSRRPRSVP